MMGLRLPAWPAQDAALVWISRACRSKVKAAELSNLGVASCIMHCHECRICMGEPVHGLMTNFVMLSVALGYDGSLGRHLQYM